MYKNEYIVKCFRCEEVFRGTKKECKDWKCSNNCESKDKTPVIPAYFKQTNKRG